MELSPFKQAIKEHLVLRAQNTVLEVEMPLARYRSEEISANHAVFKSEADAVQEETPEGAQPDWPVAEADSGLLPSGELWAGSPTFEWGD